MACVAGITKDVVDYIMDSFIDVDYIRGVAAKLNNIADAQVENWIAALETEMQGGEAGYKCLLISFCLSTIVN